MGTNSGGPEKEEPTSLRSPATLPSLLASPARSVQCPEPAAAAFRSFGVAFGLNANDHFSAGGGGGGS